MTYNGIANDEFGMDYNQLGPNEKEINRTFNNILDQLINK